MLAACAGVSSTIEEPALDATHMNETAIIQMTADFDNTELPSPTLTPTPRVTDTPIPILDRTRPPIQSPTSEVECNKAAAGSPIDVTIPDGTVRAPGENFTKIWRLKNAGTCTWTRQYALVFFSGSGLGAFQTNYLSQEVKPGEVVDLSIDMVAPQKIGIYQSNWMLSNGEGDLFGIGPHGDAPFWVQIEVMKLVTDTPQPTPTATNTPVVYLIGEADLGNGNQLDLDSGTLNPDDVTKADLFYQYGGTPTHILMTMNGMQWVVVGETEPTFGDCSQAALSGNAISFNEVPDGTYLCYRTSDSLLGRLRIEDFSAGKLSVSFLTWANKP